MSRHNTDRIMFDPDSDWQDSAQAIAHEESNAHRIPRERAPLSLGSMLLAAVIVCLCAATVIVACDAGAAEVDCLWRACA